MGMCVCVCVGGGGEKVGRGGEGGGGGRISLHTPASIRPIIGTMYFSTGASIQMSIDFSYMNWYRRCVKSMWRAWSLFCSDDDEDEPAP